MTLWRLRGYADLEGEFASSKVVCSIERMTAGYRLLVAHGSKVQVDETHLSAGSAREKAEALRVELTKQGWAAV